MGELEGLEENSTIGFFLTSDGRKIKLYPVTFNDALKLYTDNSENREKLINQLDEIIKFDVFVSSILKERKVILPDYFFQKEAYELNLLLTAKGLAGALREENRYGH
jgi:hypothetical protein